MNYKYREKFSHYLQRSPFDQMEQSVSNFCTQPYPVIQIKLRRWWAYRNCSLQHSTEANIPKRRCRSNRCCKWSRFSFKSCSLKISCESLALLKPIVRRSFASVEITGRRIIITLLSRELLVSDLGLAAAPLSPLPSPIFFLRDYEW